MNAPLTRMNSFSRAALLIAGLAGDSVTVNRFGEPRG